MTNRKVQYRHEFKYQINPSQARAIESLVKKQAMVVDEYARKNEDNSYVVTSLYYDTMHLRDYQDKAGGFIQRKKFRVRIYEPFLDNSPYGTIEIKHKHNTRNYKTKWRIDRELLDDFLQYGRQALLKNALLTGKTEEQNEILWYLGRYSLKPVVMVGYKRKPYTSKYGDNIRITFDSGLNASLQGDMKKPYAQPEVNPHISVMEVKFLTSMPYWLSDIIKNFNLRFDTYSKYERSLNRLHKYRPLIR